MKVLVIGDTHGKTIWRKFVEGHSDEVDKIIFLGDYTDSWDISNMQILEELKSIVELKKSQPGKVVLLLGNHDVQYYCNQNSGRDCSGFRPEAYFDLNDIFRSNISIFDLAYQVDNYLFTHAGLSNQWFKNVYDRVVSKGDMAMDLNYAFVNNYDSIFAVGYSRGGSYPSGGPLWADKSETSRSPLSGFHQIVGHTSIKKIEKVKLSDREDTSITYVDVLDYIQEPYILDIN